MSSATTSGSGWKSSETSALLSSDSLQKIINTYGQLETQLKVRTLLAIVHLPAEHVDKMDGDIKKLLVLAEADDDEWVKIAAGLANRWVFANAEPSTSSAGRFLDAKLNSIVQAVRQTKPDTAGILSLVSASTLLY